MSRCKLPPLFPNICKLWLYTIVTKHFSLLSQTSTSVYAFVKVVVIHNMVLMHVHLYVV